LSYMLLYRFINLEILLSWLDPNAVHLNVCTWVQLDIIRGVFLLVMLILVESFVNVAFAILHEEEIMDTWLTILS
jgi:hypothetical protein